MREIAHFSMGVAIASFVPAAVLAAQRGNPWFFLLGGVFGLLPDTLDFRFARFLYRHDVEIMPDPLRPDAALVAKGVAAAVERAAVTGLPVRLKLHAVRLAADAWLPYIVTVAPEGAGGRIEVEFLPPTDTGGQPLKRDEPAGVATACMHLGVRPRVAYAADTTVGIFDGPLIEMRPEASGGVTSVFLPWHRQWSHGVAAVLVAGAVAGVVAGPVGAFIAAMAVSAHAIMDHLGYMGTNVLYPFQRDRTPGLRHLHSMDTSANLLVVWWCVWLTFTNLARHAGFDARPFGSAQALAWGMAAPAMALGLFRLVAKRRSRRRSV
jgi:hypothetical protein